MIGTKRDGKPVTNVERVLRSDGTEAVLAEADYVVLLLPATTETRELMNRSRLARMK